MSGRSMWEENENLDDPKELYDQQKKIFRETINGLNLFPPDLTTLVLEYWQRLQEEISEITHTLPLNYSPLEISGTTQYLYVRKYGQPYDIYDFNGNKLNTFSLPTNHIFVFQNDIYAITDDTFYILNLKGNFIKSWSLPYKLKYLYTSVCRDKDGRIYIANNTLVYVHNMDGKLIDTFGESSGARSIHAITTNDNPISHNYTKDNFFLYICDTDKERIQVLDYRNGIFLFKFGKAESSYLVQPQCLFYTENILYVGDSQSIQIFSEDGKLLQKIPYSACGIVAIRDCLYACNANDKSILVFSLK